ncbi:MAG: sulfatase family protein [Parasphingopyxis sp.]
MPFNRRQFISGVGALAASMGYAHASPSRRPPNIVFILADDLGCSDISLLGRTEYSTPHIDSIGTGGVVLPQGYANSSVCSPTRFALATGRYQYRLRGGLEEPIGAEPEPVGLPPEHPTIASEFRNAGYRTALIGKWHMGSLPDYGPTLSGYDSFFGVRLGYADYFSHSDHIDGSGGSGLYEGRQIVERHGYLTDLLSDRAARDISAAARDRVPLFMSLHYTAPHWPWEGPEDEEASRRIRYLLHHDGGSEATYAEMVGALDRGIGRVLGAIERSGQADNTIVVFTSDNGGERFSYTWPYVGMKGDLLEGGIRVPLLIRWPDRIAPGSVSEQTAMSMDFLPTLLAAAGHTPDPRYPADGLDILPQITGSAEPVDRKLYWRHKANDQKAVRFGQWKWLSINGHEYLFDLSRDRQERANLADHQPEIFAELRADWEAWNATMLPYPDDSFSYSLNGAGQIAEHD